MSSRYISVEEINSLREAIEDKRGIELLKAIRDNVVQESDVKKEQNKNVEGKSKEEQAKEQERVSQEKSFIGFTKEEKLIKEGEEDEGKKGVLRRLEEKGLVLSGGYIPLGKERINSYKLTNEGRVLLHFAETIKGEVKEQSQQQQQQQKPAKK